jgi:hypothetical protein
LPIDLRLALPMGIRGEDRDDTITARFAAIPGVDIPRPET